MNQKLLVLTIPDVTGVWNKHIKTRTEGNNYKYYGEEGLHSCLTNWVWKFLTIPTICSGPEASESGS